MRRREAELSRTRLAQRAYSLLSMDRSSVAHQIHLRIVREFGLPDSTVEVLQGSIDHAPHRQDMCLPLAGACYLTPVRSRHALLCQHHTTHRLHQYSRTDSRLSTSMIQPVVHPCNHMEVIMSCHCWNINSLIYSLSSSFWIIVIYIFIVNILTSNFPYQEPGHS